MSMRSSFKSFSLVAALAALGSAGCSSNSPELDVEILVDSGLLPAPVNAISASISAEGHQTVSVDLPAVSDQHWVVRPQNVTKAFTALITVVGQAKSDAGVSAPVTAYAYVRISPGVSQSVQIELSPKCKDVHCDTMQTCQAGACVPIPQIGVDGGLPSTGTGGGNGTGGSAGGTGGSGAKGGAGGGGAAGAGGSTGSGGAAGASGAAGGGGSGGAAGGGATGGRGGTAGAGTGGTAGAGAGGMAGAGQGGVGGKPKLNPGDACTATADCASGVCSSADHICCDSDCAGTCESCVGTKTGKANGACNPLPAGSNADNDCAPGATTCGTTGSCDGNRKCAFAAATTPCTGSSSCSGSQLTTTPAACDGKGTCVPGTPAVSACPGGVTCMSATACLPSSCSADTSCTSGSYCDLGTHTCTAKKDLGGACSGTNQCTSGFCADGVCCNNACGGTCEACVKTKTGVSDGHCAAVSSGTDPDSECAADGTACGHTGLCNQNGGSGGGACAYTSSGTNCGGSFSCSGNGSTMTTTGSCDGAGTCKQSSPTAGTCNGYSCASASACQTTCTGPSQCASGYSCASATCTPSIFKTGPCVTTPDFTAAVVFALGSDGKIHQKSAANGTSFGAWTTLSLDASGIDARSDLDCSANYAVTHITATGNNPVGAFLHSSGSGTTYNPFFRELTSESFSPPGASIKAGPSGNGYVIGALDSIPSFWDVSSSGTYTNLQPITTYTTTITSTIDVSEQPVGGGAVRILVGLDSAGKFDVYNNQIDSGGPRWFAPVIIAPPSGTTFQYSPTICVDTGAMGGSTVHLAAVAGGAVYDAYDTGGSGGPFTTWEKAGTGAAAAVDCTMLGDGTVHIVTLNSAGHVLDVHGNPGSWTTSDLGVF